MISATDFLRNIFNEITKDGKEIVLPIRAIAEISKELNCHRSKVGYIGYSTAKIVKIGQKIWLLAFGEKCGGELSENYDCDIAAIKLCDDGDIDKVQLSCLEAYSLLCKNEHFVYSLLFARANGNLAYSEDGYYWPLVVKNLSANLSRNRVSEFKFDTNPMPPTPSNPTLYEARLVGLYRDCFREVLTVAS